jgi:hypothetical protein
MSDQDLIRRGDVLALMDAEQKLYGGENTSYLNGVNAALFHAREVIAALPAAAPTLAVWYGSMPESNGRKNWTASLHRKDGNVHMDGFCFARSEYPDRVRYEADRMRWIIGEITEKPDILAYDADLHSGYVAPAATPTLADALALPEVRALVEAACRDDRPVAMKEFLHWIADRLVLHGDAENVDFVISLRERANRLDAALATIKGVV